MSRFITITGFAALACVAAFAQKDDTKVFFLSTSDSPKIRPDGFAGGVSAARFGLMGPTVKGAPYSADGVTETNQTLGDGTHINRQQTYTISRDSEGRIRRESGDEVWISDPVANVSYVINTKQQSARKLALTRTVSFSKMDVKTDSGAHAAKLTAEISADGPIIISDGPIAAGHALAAAEPDGAKREALGKQSMEGVEVDGTRTTRVIPVGQMGNDRPMQYVQERWESSDLHVTVLSRNTDPIVGETVERLTNIQRVEPDPTLFQVPASYTIAAEK